MLLVGSFLLALSESATKACQDEVTKHVLLLVSASNC